MEFRIIIFFIVADCLSFNYVYERVPFIFVNVERWNWKLPHNIEMFLFFHLLIVFDYFHF